MDGKNFETENEKFQNAVDLMEYPTSLDCYGSDDTDSDSILYTSNIHSTIQSNIHSYIQDAEKDRGIGRKTSFLDLAQGSRPGLHFLPRTIFDTRYEDLKNPRHKPDVRPKIPSFLEKDSTTFKAGYIRAGGLTLPSVTAKPPIPPGRPISAPPRKPAAVAQGITFPSLLRRLNKPQGQSSSSPRESKRDASKARLASYPRSSSKSNKTKAKSNSSSPRSSSKPEKLQASSFSLPSPFSFHARPKARSVSSPVSSPASSPREIIKPDKARPRSSSSPRDHNKRGKPQIKSSTSPKDNIKNDKIKTKSSTSPKDNIKTDKPKAKSISSTRGHSKVNKPRPKSGVPPIFFTTADKSLESSSTSLRESNKTDTPRPKSRSSPRDKDNAEKPRPKSSASPRQFNTADNSRARSSTTHQENVQVDKPRAKSNVSPRDYSNPVSRPTSSSSNYSKTDKVLARPSSALGNNRKTNSLQSRFSSLPRIKTDKPQARSSSSPRDNSKMNKPQTRSNFSPRNYNKANKSPTRSRNYNKGNKAQAGSSSSPRDCKVDIPLERCRAVLEDYLTPDDNEVSTISPKSLSEADELKSTPPATNKSGSSEVEPSYSSSNFTNVTELDNTSSWSSEKDAEFERLVNERMTSLNKGVSTSTMPSSAINDKIEDSGSDISNDYSEDFEAEPTDMKEFGTDSYGTTPEPSTDNNRELINKLSPDLISVRSLTPTENECELAAALNYDADSESIGKESSTGRRLSKEKTKVSHTEEVEPMTVSQDKPTDDIAKHPRRKRKRNRAATDCVDIDTDSEKENHNKNIRRRKLRKRVIKVAPAVRSKVRFVEYDADLEDGSSGSKQRERGEKNPVKKDYSQTEYKNVDENLDKKQDERMDTPTPHGSETEERVLTEAKTSRSLSDLASSKTDPLVDVSEVLESGEMNTDDRVQDLTCVDRANSTPRESPKERNTVQRLKVKCRGALNTLLRRPDDTSASDKATSKNSEKKKGRLRRILGRIRDAVIPCYKRRHDDDEYE